MAWMSVLSPAPLNFCGHQNMVTVVIPHLPERKKMLDRALASVENQTLQPYSVIVQTDSDGEGSAVTRNKGLDRVQTPLVAFLDDDDEMLPDHLSLLYNALLDRRRYNEVLAWSLYQTIGSDYQASFIESAVLGYTGVIRQVGGFPVPEPGSWANMYEDYGMLCRLIMSGHSFVKVDQVTWRRHIHDSNTIGEGNADHQWIREG